MNVTITITVPVGATASDVAVTSDVATSPTGDQPPAIPDGAHPPEPADLIGTAFVPPTGGDATERGLATETFGHDGASDDAAAPPSLAELGLPESAPSDAVEPPSVEEIAATEAATADAAPPAIHEVRAAEVSDVSDVSEEGPPDLDIAGFDGDLPDVAPDEEPPSIDELRPPAKKRKPSAKRAARRTPKN